MTATTISTRDFDHDAPTLAVAAGRTLVSAGALFGAANLVQWSILSGVAPISPAFLSLTWPLAVGGFLIILRRLRTIGGENGRRAAGWSRWAILGQIGAALTLLLLSVALRDWDIMRWMSPIGLGFYAIAWSAAVIRGGERWMAVVALGAALGAVGVALLVGTPAQYLAYATGLAAFVLAPGLVLTLRPAR